MCHRVIQELLDPGISLKIMFDILSRFFPRDAQILAQPERTDPVYDPEVHCLGISPLKIRHFIKRRVEYLGRGHPVDISCIPVCLDELFISGAVRQDPQLDLGIIRIHEHISLSRHKDFPDQPAKLHPYRYILKVGFRAAQSPGRGHCLIEFPVYPPVRPDKDRQPVRIS